MSAFEEAWECTETGNVDVRDRLVAEGWEPYAVTTHMKLEDPLFIWHLRRPSGRAPIRQEEEL